MQIITCQEPGKLTLNEKERPSIKKGYAQIKIRRIGICGTDLHAFEGTQPYFSYPRVLGHELSGELVNPNGAPGITEGEIVTFIPYLCSDSSIPRPVPWQ
jgi:threonine dehydrogenase-like Zn-dependent dehydrogenase